MVHPTNSSGGRGLIAAALLASVSFVACATGSQVNAVNEGGIVGGEGGGGRDGRAGGKDGGDGSTGGETGGPAPIGGLCNSKGCAPPGECMMLGGGQYCTEPCPSSGSCPTGTYCSLIEGTPICVPYLGQECSTCTSPGDCKVPSDGCLTSPAGEHFCARDCTLDSVCPSGYTCETLATYTASGASDAGGGGDGGGASDAASGADGSDAASGADAGGVLKWCVPMGGAGCTCSPKNNGATETCTVANMYGTCTAQSTCDGNTGKWVGCPAPATQEICNGKDDNCDGQIDEGDPNMLCAFMGSPPPNQNWACTDGTCVPGACAAGWADFPPGGPASAGCTCAVSADEPDATCATATNIGMVESVGGTPLVISGTLSSAMDVNVFTFNTVDTNEMTTNSYHVAINFTAPATNTEFVMDVIRGSPCSDTPTGGAANITSYDWCVNASSGMLGEAPCSPTGVNQCADHSSVYFLRVYRAAGATPTCTPYQITITGGGGTCDLTKTCT